MTDNQPTSPPSPAPELVNDRLGRSLTRLTAALALLEGAVERERERFDALSDQQKAYGALQDDRQKLAVDLDGALVRLRGLEATQDDMIRRIERARGAVHEILAMAEVAD